MTIDSTLAITAAAGLSALLLVDGLSALHANHRARRDAVRRRLRLPGSGAEVHDNAQTLRRQASNGRALHRRLERLVRHAGLTVPANRVIVPLAVLALGVVPPLLVLHHLKRKRLMQMAEQFPDALDLMARSLQAGHPIGAAMALVAKEMPDPLGAEFGLAVDEMTYGLDLREALVNLSERAPLKELHYVIVSITIQHETGGNLAEILHGLAGVIRARFGMTKKIRALSAEARLSAKLLAAMPILFGGLVFLARPEIFTEVAGDPLFLPLLGTAAALELIGILVMRRMVGFRV